MAFVEYEKKGGVVIITINRPDRMNALGRGVRDGIKDSMEKFENDPEARVAILTANGRAFCAGNDIKDKLDQSLVGKPGSYEYEPYEYRIPPVTKPVIAAINGFALGSGLVWAMDCDIRIAAESATFGMPEITLGLYGDAAMINAEGIPLAVAMDIALTGDRISAHRAYELGVISRIVPDTELMPAAMKVAERIAGFPPMALKLTKQDLKKAVEMPGEVRSLRLKNVKWLSVSEDAREAASAFVEKRKPVFKGK